MPVFLIDVIETTRGIAEVSAETYEEAKNIAIKAVERGNVFWNDTQVFVGEEPNTHINKEMLL